MFRRQPAAGAAAGRRGRHPERLPGLRSPRHRNGTAAGKRERGGRGGAGHGRPARSHVNPLRGKPCTGPLRWRSLAHTYETDILRLRVDAPGLDSRAQWHTLLYALLEGAAEGLEISRADISGVVHAGADGSSGLVLFDTVPGGAGSAARIARALDDA